MNALLRGLTGLLAAGSPVLALPYTARPLPAGFNAATVPSSVSGSAPLFSQAPAAVDFLSNGTRQWYAGGTVITRFPENGTVTLPGLTLSLVPSATVAPLTGVPCDVDADGDQDIVRINKWNGHSFYYTLQVFLNNGSGGFSTGYRYDWERMPAYDEGQHILRLVPGDFDKDGFADVAILETYELSNWDTNPNRDEGQLFIRWNDRTGQFPATTSLQGTGFDGYASASAADYDSDGDLDLVCDRHTTWSSNDSLTFTTRLFTNNGARAFTSSTLPGRPSQFTDLNLDGWPELANGWQFAWNDPSSGLGGTNTVNSTAHESFVYADADDDTIPDLVHGEGNVLVYYKGTLGGAPSATPVTMTSVAGPAIALSAADSDADGDTDFFVTLRNGGFAFVENRGLHMVPGAYDAGTASVSGATELHTADFNLDGGEDLLAVAPSEEKLWVMYGEADGIPAAAVFKNTQSEAPHSAAVADFDHDGRPDVAYTLPSTGVVRMARNTGNVPFLWTDTAIATGLPGVSLLVPGQHSTPNGLTDLLTCNGTTGQFRWVYQSSDDWNGQSVLNSFSPVPGSIMAVQATARPGDEPFLLAANASTLTLRGYQLNPTWVTAGTDRSEPVSGGSHASAMVWADANKDGEKEAVFIAGDGSLGVYNPISTARFNIGTAPGGLRAIAAVDWDRNGHTDFLCGTGTGLSLFRYHRVTGLWDHTAIITHNGGFKAVTALDLNRDRYMDAAAVDSTGQIHFIRNFPLVLEASFGNGTAVDLPVGKAGTAMAFTAKTAGRGTPGTWLNDADAVFTGARLVFNRAVPSGDSWGLGPSLTQSELSAAVSSISLLGGSTVIGSSGPAALAAEGNLQVNYHPVLGNLVPVAPGAIYPHSIQLTITPGALQSGTTRFFVRLFFMSGAPQDGQTAITPGEGWPVRLTGNAAALVTIVPDYTPLQAWRALHFGAPDATGLRANDADYDQDGVPNLMEYLTGTNPTLGEPALNAANALTILPLLTAQSLVKYRLVLGNAAMGDPKLRLTIQQSTGLNAWTTQTSRTGGSLWSGTQPVLAIGETHTTMLFTPGFTPQATPEFHLRLKAEELP